MEFNKETLDHAKANLKVYTPPTFLWDEIESVLNQEQAQQNLQKAISSLPAYNPPTEIWDKIEDQLPKQKGKLLVLLQNRWINLGIAASFLLLFYIVWNGSQSNQPIISYTETEETVTPILVDWDSDSETINLLVEEFQRSISAQQDINYDSWKVEMDELLMARTELVDAIKLYGEDDQLIKELNNIDEAITSLGNKMYKLI